MPRFGKNATCELSLTEGGTWVPLHDTPTSAHGFSDFVFTPSAPPIERPAKDDMRYEEAAQTARSYSFSVEADDDTDPLFWDRAGKRVWFRIGPKGNASGALQLTGSAILTGDLPYPMPVDGLVRYAVDMSVDGPQTTGTFA